MSEQAISDDFERHEAIRRAGIIVMDRLRKLMRKGYRPDVDMEFTESIWLRHPAKTERWPHSTLILFPDGLLVSIEPKDEPRFAVWEKAEFEAFLRKVPLPTWRERSQDRRDRWKAYVFIAVFMGLLLSGAVYVAMFLERFFGLRP